MKEKLKQKERLVKFMQSLNMNPTQFAQSIEIQRATLQHVLSGRNEMSLNLVASICNKYTELNMEWLVFGREPMYTDSRPVLTPQAGQVDRNDETLIFSMEEMGAPKNQNLSEVGNNVVQQDQQPVSNQQSSGSKPTLNKWHGATSTSAPAAMTNPPSPLAVPLAQTAQHHIKEVVVFFDDGTYERLFI